jgi:C-terminal processing protease CtpA/Prc
VPGVIVDLRENSGGNTAVGELLLERLTDKPYRQAAAKHWRVSRQYQAFVDWDTRYDEATPGEVLHYRWQATPPREVSPRYAGRVCFLIGPNTHSSAMMLANAVEDYDLGMLIGEPTASPPNYFGEVYSFELPLTKLQVQSSVAAFVRANGDESDPNPVLPEIRLAPSLEQWARGDDPVLERALEYVRSGK